MYVYASTYVVNNEAWHKNNASLYNYSWKEKQRLPCAKLEKKNDICNEYEKRLKYYDISM